MARQLAKEGVVPGSIVRALPVCLREQEPFYLVLLAVAAGYILAFIGTGLLRAVYPYPIDALEHGAMQEAARIRSGLPIYVAPSLEYVPQIYGPAYFYLAAAVSALLRSDLAGLRVASVLASLGAIALIGLLVRRETRNPSMGLIGGALFAACNPLVDGAMDIGRTDALAVFFMLAAIYAAHAITLDSNTTPYSGAIVGVLTALLLATKQSGAAVAVAILGVLAVYRRDQLATCVLTLIGSLGLMLLLLSLQGGRWPLFYLWELPRQHEILPPLMSRFWTHLVEHFAVPALVGPFYLIARIVGGERRRAVFWVAVLGAMLAGAWTSQATIRGGRNVELPAYAALSLLFAFSLAEVLKQLRSQTRFARAARAYVLAAAIGQFAVVVYNPRLHVPYRSDIWAGERLAQTLATLPGPIFAGSYWGYVPHSPDFVAPDLEAVVELQGEQVRPSSPEGEEWSLELARALRERRFTYLIVNPDLDGFIVPLLADAYDYVHVGPLFPPGDKYWEWRTGWAPKAELYVRP
jgi:hypothetical protein